jgi:hypothetical protein
MVHRGGFEPPYVIDGQIYSLLPLTTRPPVHILPIAFPNSIRNPNPRKPSLDQILEIERFTFVEDVSGGLCGQNGLTVQPNPNSSQTAGNLELAKGLEPPTL